jgi:hypothetical protein
VQIDLWNKFLGTMLLNFAIAFPKKQDASTVYQPKQNGNTPVALALPPLFILEKLLPPTWQTITATTAINLAQKRKEAIEIKQFMSKLLHLPMLLDYLICTATFGSGAAIAGMKAITKHPQMAVRG